MELSDTARLDELLDSPQWRELREAHRPYLDALELHEEARQLRETAKRASQAAWPRLQEAKAAWDALVVGDGAAAWRACRAREAARAREGAPEALASPLDALLVPSRG